MKLTHIALVLALGLLGVTTWLAWDARIDAKGAHNRLELVEQQKVIAPSPAEVQEKENQILMRQMAGKKDAPGTAAAAPIAVPPPLPPAGSPAAPGGSKIDMSHTGAAALQASPPPLTPRQRMVMAVPAIGKIAEYRREYAFVVITAGSDKKLETGMTFAIRRGPGVIGRIKITSVESAGKAVADLDVRTVPAGVTIEAGDDVIQDLPPEA